MMESLEGYPLQEAETEAARMREVFQQMKVETKSSAYETEDEKIQLRELYDTAEELAELKAQIVDTARVEVTPDQFLYNDSIASSRKEADEYIKQRKEQGEDPSQYMLEAVHIMGVLPEFKYYRIKKAIAEGKTVLYGCKRGVGKNIPRSEPGADSEFHFWAILEETGTTTEHSEEASYD